VHLPNRPSPDQLFADQIRASLGLAGRVRTGETHAVLSFGTLFSCQGAPSLPPVGADSMSALLFVSVFRGAITARGGTSTPDHHFGKESSPTRDDGT
jgi:hypothetical protein